jgi:hypothetical protein
MRALRSDLRSSFRAKKSAIARRIAGSKNPGCFPLRRLTARRLQFHLLRLYRSRLKIIPEVQICGCSLYLNPYLMIGLAGICRATVVNPNFS